MLPVLGTGEAASLGTHLGPILTDVVDDAMMVSIEGAGHFVTKENPAEVASALRSFVPAHPA